MSRSLALIGGILWLAAMALIAVVLARAEHSRIVHPLTTVPLLIRELNAARSDDASWTVTKAISAHHVLVVDVSAARVEDSRGIASSLMKAVSARGYEEVLVYVWNARAPARFAERRVQWTRAQGFTELVIGN